MLQEKDLGRNQIADCAQGLFFLTSRKLKAKS
jgi:hypothetical protein